jgi:hypothetical protein
MTQRRGRCRCGTILEFEKTSLGYKTRCPQCRSIVRLRLDKRAAQAASRRKKASSVLTVPPPSASRPEAAETGPSVGVLATPAQGDLPALPADFDVLDERFGTAAPAQVETEVYHDPTPARYLALWGLFGLGALVIVAAVATAAILWG